MAKKPLHIYAIFLVIVLLVSMLIGTTFAPGAWYASIQKPSFTPPNWIFGPMWTFLYILIAIAGARLVVKGPHPHLLRLWKLQMLANWCWTPLFFGLQQPLFAFINILILLSLISIFILRAWKTERFCAYLFIPYVIWVSYASALNASIAMLSI